MSLKTLKKRKPFEVTCPEGMNCTLDPLGKYTKMEPSRIWNSLGLLPYFVANANEEANNGDTKAVAENLLACYGFGHDVDYNMLDANEGSQIDKDGVYSFPEDPDLYPLARFELGDTLVYIYEYALVAVDDGETQWMQRFD